MADKSLIGKETPPGRAEAIPEEMIAFCESVSDIRPEYMDKDSANKGPFGALVAPPTFPMRFLFDALDPDLFFEPVLQGLVDSFNGKNKIWRRVW